jgi:ATP-dependent Clp protease protease subunit
MEGYALPPSRYQDAYANLAASRSIFISEEITKGLAAEISGLLLYYDQADDSRVVNIYLNTPGGDSSALSNIIAVMDVVRSPLRTVNLAKAFSAGAFILASGTKGMRYSMKSACTMLHGIQCDTPPSDQKSSEIYLQFLKDHNKQVLSIIARRTGKSLEQIEKDCLQDVYMDACQAKEYGLIDHIL